MTASAAPHGHGVPLVAAVAINFGPPADTFECVRSLLGNGYPALRVYVVDNRTSDENLRALREGLPAGGVTLIEAPRNLGFAGGNNLAIGRALEEGAEFVLLLNNDATLAPGAVRCLVDAATARPDAGIVTGKVYAAAGPTDPPVLWYGGGVWSPLRASGYHLGMGEMDRGQYDRPADVRFIPGCLWLVSAAVFRRCGLLPEAYFVYGEDADFGLTLQRAGYRLVYEPAAHCYHKVSRATWKDRSRASPTVNYYTNRNRILLARRWLTWWERCGFAVYLVATRLVLAARRGDRSYLAGLRDGLLGVTGPGPMHRAP